MIYPEYVEECSVCKGEGEYKQAYNVGCGGGMFEMTGPCSWCKHPDVFMKGLGYRMKSGAAVPLSVINQIEVAKNRLRSV